jgi:hypothetical protein
LDPVARVVVLTMAWLAQGAVVQGSGVRVPVPMTVPLLEKLTVPVGAAPRLLGELSTTVAVNVTCCIKFEALPGEDETTLVAVVAGLMVRAPAIRSKA